MRDTEILDKELSALKGEYTSAETQAEADIQELRYQRTEEDNVVDTLTEIKLRREEEAAHLRELLEKLTANRRMNIKVSTHRVERFDESRGRLVQEAVTYTGKKQAADRAGIMLDDQRDSEGQKVRTSTSQDDEMVEVEVKCSYQAKEDFSFTDRPLGVQRDTHKSAEQFSWELKHTPGSMPRLSRGYKPFKYSRKTAQILSHKPVVRFEKAPELHTRVTKLLDDIDRKFTN